MDRPSAHRSAHNSPTENSSSILFLSIFHPSDQIAIGPSDLSGDDLEANPEVNMIRNPLFFFFSSGAGPECVCVRSQLRAPLIRKLPDSSVTHYRPLFSLYTGCTGCRCFCCSLRVYKYIPPAGIVIYTCGYI